MLVLNIFFIVSCALISLILMRYSRESCFCGTSFLNLVYGRRSKMQVLCIITGILFFLSSVLWEIGLAWSIIFLVLSAICVIMLIITEKLVKVDFKSVLYHLPSLIFFLLLSFGSLIFGTAVLAIIYFIFPIMLAASMGAYNVFTRKSRLLKLENTPLLSGKIKILIIDTLDTDTALVFKNLLCDKLSCEIMGDYIPLSEPKCEADVAVFAIRPVSVGYLLECIAGIQPDYVAVLGVQGEAAKNLAQKLKLCKGVFTDNPKLIISDNVNCFKAENDDDTVLGVLGRLASEILA